MTTLSGSAFTPLALTWPFEAVGPHLRAYGRTKGGHHLRNHERSDEQERPGIDARDERECHLEASPGKEFSCSNPYQWAGTSLGESGH